MIYTPFVWLLLISAFVSGGIAYYTRRYQGVSFVKPFRILMWLAATWALLYGLEISVVDLPFKVFLANVTYIPSVLSTLAAFVLALEYTGHGEWLTRPRLMLFMVMPAIFLVVAFTSGWHSLWRFDYQLHWSASVPVIVATKGPVYWVYVAYMLGMSIATFVILLTAFRHATLYFYNTLMLTLGMLIPVITGLLYVFNLTPRRGFDWLPASFIGMGLFCLWVILRGRLFEVVPLAHNTLIENIQDFVIAVNTQGLIVDFNRAAQVNLGLSPAMIGKSPLGLLQPWAGIFQRFANTTAGKEEVVIDAQHSYELSISPIQNHQAALLGKLFLFHDITDHKRAAADTAFLAAIVESSNDAIFGKTLDGIILSWNAGAEKMYGYTTEEVVGRHVSVLAPPDYKDEITHILERLRYGEIIQHWETVRQRKDGSCINVALTISPIKDQTGNITGASTVSHDITERKRAEEKVRQLSQAVEQSPASIVITDLEGIIEYVNPRFTQITGYSLDEAVGQNPRILKSGKTSPETYRELWDTLTSRRVWHGEFVNRKKNGALYLESATITPVFDSHGTVTHYLAIKEDVTELKQGEARLRSQNERLNALHHITLDLLNRPKMEEILEAILFRAADLLQSPFGLLDIVEDETLVIKANTEGFAALKNMRIPLKDARLSLQTIESRKPQVLDDYSNWPWHLGIYNEYHLKAVVNFPIISNEKVIGLIALGRTDLENPYTDDEVEIMSSFAQLAALALDNAQLLATAQNELMEKQHAEIELRNANQVLLLQLEAIELLQTELRQQAIRDPLTGLYNRRYLNEALGHELRRAGREDYPVSFVMLDIDHFKLVNDTFGHSAGDRILQRLAWILVSQTRASDIVCRYGGEEFLIILSKVDGKTAFQIAEKWQNAFNTPEVSEEGMEMQVTFSGGIATFAGHAMTSEEVIANADQALYLAKKMGRNRVMVWARPTPPTPA